MGTDIYTIPCGKYIATGKPLYNTGSPAWHSDDSECWDVGRFQREGTYMAIVMTNLCCYMAETNTIL